MSDATEMTAINQNEQFEFAKNCYWKYVRMAFTSYMNHYSNVFQSCLRNNNWDEVKKITLPVTYNKKNNSYCCWEAGGAINDSGKSVIIAEANGVKSRAISYTNNKNGKHAIIKVWPGKIFAIGSQVRGQDVVCVYKLHNFSYEEVKNEKSGVNNYVSVAVLHLSRVYDNVNNTILKFDNELDEVITDAFVMAAYNKMFTYNCYGATYTADFIRIPPFKYADEYNGIIEKLIDPNVESNICYPDSEQHLKNIVQEFSDNTSYDFENNDTTLTTNYLIFTHIAGCDDDGVIMRLYAVKHTDKGIESCGNKLEVRVTEDIFNNYFDLFTAHSYQQLRNYALATNISTEKKVHVFKYINQFANMNR